MLSRVTSGVILGVDACPVSVEVNISNGMPALQMVGLPGNAVKESRVRVEAAIKNCGYRFPVNHITVNLAPADLKKDGAAFDLPIALGILAGDGCLDHGRLADFMIAGELSLHGEVNRINGALPLAVAAKKAGAKGILVPQPNAAEASFVEGVDVIPVRTFSEAAEFMAGRLQIEACKRVDATGLLSDASPDGLDFSEVRGQQHAKRALEVAAAGGHNAIMIGPPGSGKTMLAKRLPTILPEMTLEEAIETTKIHSVAGLLRNGTPLVTRRPFRAPHHTVSDAGLVGGGSVPRPGEISLSHNGVLFLDELPEFRRNVLEVLRQPLEDGCITICRARSSFTFPASMMLIAAMNPCPCGFLGDRARECSCSPDAIQRYRNRISGPLLDRIDIHLEMSALRFCELGEAEEGEPSARIRERVNAARRVQKERLKAVPGVHSNSCIPNRFLAAFCRPDAEAYGLLRAAMEKLGLSARAYTRVLRVARTIADLAASERVRTEHVSEAIQYRCLDREI